MGVILGVPKSVRVSGAQKVLRLINTLRIQLITFWGSRFERKWMTLKMNPKMTPKMALLVSPVSQKRINKVLARIN